jgi:hypothetical protein
MAHTSLILRACKAAGKIKTAVGELSQNLYLVVIADRKLDRQFRFGERSSSNRPESSNNLIVFCLIQMNDRRYLLKLNLAHP